MALRLKHAPPKKAARPSAPPKEDKKEVSKPLDIDREIKWDPNAGSVVFVDENREHKRYPSCDATTRVAKCVYCDKVKDKALMRCLGQNWHEKGSLRYVWACKTCFAGSPTWLKHYRHKSPFGHLWNYDLDKDKRIKRSDEEEHSVGKAIVEKRKEQVEDSIVKALSKIKKKRVKENRKKFVDTFAKKKEKQIGNMLNPLKGSTQPRSGKGVSVELKGKLGRGTVVVARAEDEKHVTIPRWKRKGRAAKIRGSR